MFGLDRPVREKTLPVFIGPAGIVDVAQMDDVLRGREAAESVVGPTADDIFARMSAFMEAPTAA